MQNRTLSVVGVSGLLCILPLLPAVTQTPLSSHDFARVAQILLLLLVALLLAIAGPGSTEPSAGRTRPTLRRLVVGLLLVLIVCSTAASALPLIAAREVVLFAGLFGLAQWTAGSLTDVIALRRVLRIIAVGTLVYGACVSLLFAVHIATDSLQDPWLLLLGFDNPRFLNHCQTVALPLVAAVCAGDTEPRWRRLAGLALFFSGGLLFMTLGRATALSLLVGMLSAWWMFKRRGWHFVRSAVLPTLLGMVVMWLCYLKWVTPTGLQLDPEQMAQTHSRGFLLHEALKLWQTSPWLGVGPMHFSHWYNRAAAHPHNIYLQTLAEYGWPTTAILVVGAFAWLFKAQRQLRRATEANIPIAMAFWTSLLGIAVDGTFSGNFVMPLSQLWIALAAGLSIAFLRMLRQAPTTDQEPPNVAGGFVSLGRVGLAAAMIWLCIVALADLQAGPLPTLPTQGPEARPAGGERLFNPRFWIHGWF